MYTCKEMYIDMHAHMCIYIYTPIYAHSVYVYTRVYNESTYVYIDVHVERERERERERESERHTHTHTQRDTQANSQRREEEQESRKRPEGEWVGAGSLRKSQRDPWAPNSSTHFPLGDRLEIGPYPCRDAPSQHISITLQCVYGLP